MSFPFMLIRLQTEHTFIPPSASFLCIASNLADGDVSCPSKLCRTSQIVVAAKSHGSKILRLIQDATETVVGPVTRGACRK